MRYILETLRPEIHQYFVEPDQGGRPFNRDQRAQVYQRAKNIDAVMPFGTRFDVYEEGYEWVTHSLWPQAYRRGIVTSKHWRCFLLTAVFGFNYEHFSYVIWRSFG